MTDAARVPKEETRFADDGARAVEDAATSDRGDLKNGACKGQPGESAVNADQQGRFGDLKQNLMNQWKVREAAATTQA